MRLCCVIGFALTVCACYGQSLTLGVVGGGRLTDDLTGNATSESKRYAVGPEAELSLPFGLAIEVDAIYRREGYLDTAPTLFSSVPVGFQPYYQYERANSWEVPVLLKYKTSFPVVKPFVEAGYAPRVLSGTLDSFTTTYCNPITNVCQGGQSTQTGTNWKPSNGLIIGGGVQVGLGRLRISPEVRFTRWSNAAIEVTQLFSFQSTQNQVDVLVGIGWKVH
jgi:hypothetical protein